MYTVLGKVFAVLTILFYVQIDILFGLLVCGFVIYIYQNDTVEPMINMNDLVSWMDPKQNIAKEEPEGQNSGLANDFEEKHCELDTLTYKGNTVRPDMIEHVFPEIQFYEQPCNPCLSSCSYSIDANKQSKEDTTIHMSTLT
jgi:hypothetical protein